jgi:hypothetical protein
LTIDEPIDDEITVVYLALTFHASDIRIIKPILVSFLKTLQGRPIVFLLGHPDATFAALCPHTRHFSRSGEHLLYSGLASADSAFDDLPAPIVLLSACPTDICPFIFAPQQIPTVINTIGRLDSISGRTSLSPLLDVNITLTTLFPKSPVHAIAIVPTLRTPPSIFPNPDRLFRFDLVAAVYNESIEQTLSIIPGSTLVFTGFTLLKILTSLVADRSVYQLLARVRARGVAPSWRLLPYPAQFEEDGLLSCTALPTRRQPFVLDLKPLGESEAVVQITAKMVIWSNSDGKYLTVLRIFNRKLSLTEKVGDLVKSVNVRVLLWLWLTRTLDQSMRNVLAGIFRAAAGIISAGGDPADLSRGCCALKFCDFAGEDAHWRSNGRYSLCLTPPSMYPLVPHYDKDAGFAVCGNAIFADEEGNDGAVKAYHASFVGGRISRPIPDWCKHPDPKTLEFLNSLISD